MHIHEWHSVCICIMARRTKNIAGTKLSLQKEVSRFDSKFPFHPHFEPFPFHVQTPLTDWTPQTSSSLSIILKPWTWKVIKSFHLCQTWWVSWCDPFSCLAIKHQVLITSTYNSPNSSHMYTISPWMPPCCVISIAPPTAIYMTFIGLLSISYTTR